MLVSQTCPGDNDPGTGRDAIAETVPKVINGDGHGGGTAGLPRNEYQPDWSIRLSEMIL